MPSLSRHRLRPASSGWSSAATGPTESGPKPVLYAATALFVVGLLVAGGAFEMPMIVLGRLIYGLAGGAVTVAIYVIVARLYPAQLQPRIFGAYAAAWVIPSLIGPFAAGLIAQYLSWHWVFLGVVVLVVPALIMVLPAMRAIPIEQKQDAAPWSLTRFGWAALVAVAVLGLDLANELSGWASRLIPAIALVTAIMALRPLLPPGTLRAVRGLPSVIGTRGLLAGAYFGAEVYVPYLLINRYGLTASTAGLALTGAGIVWAAASWLQGRGGVDRHSGYVRTGVAIVTVALGIVLCAALLALPAWVVIGAWAVGGGGMGLAYPRLSVLTLGHSTPESQGFNSSAMSIADAGGGAIALAVTGIVFAALASLGPAIAISGCLMLTILLALGAGATSSQIAPALAATSSETRLP